MQQESTKQRAGRRQDQSMNQSGAVTANDKGVGVTSAIITGVELLEENVEWRSVTGETCGSGGR